MAALRRQLTRARAEALELAPDAFDALFDEPHTQLKVCHYPPLQAAAGERRRQRQRSAPKLTWRRRRRAQQTSRSVRHPPDPPV